MYKSDTPSIYVSLFVYICQNICVILLCQSVIVVLCASVCLSVTRCDIFNIYFAYNYSVYLSALFGKIDRKDWWRRMRG